MKARYYMALAALTLPLAANAQSVIDFEDADSIPTVGVFDTWEDSPFRKGTLKGNVKVIDNPKVETADDGSAVNTSKKVLAFQRSRFGSNTFGVRIDLKTPLELDQNTKYVHVKINKPKAGRVMLFALGKRTSWTSQSAEVVQVEASTRTTVKADGTWYEAVFPMSSAKGVEIHSLVIATDVESTHNLASDYVAYIDDIEINTSSKASLVKGVYPTAYEKTEQLSRTDRYVNSVSLTVDGTAQTIATTQGTDKLLFQDCLASNFVAKPGDTVTAGISYKGTWMSGYVYLDKDNNGKFSWDINDNGTPADGTDLVTYSYYNGKNSAGNTVANGNTLSMPSFTIPADLKPGFYRMRYKVDWDNIDPAGNTSESNDIKANGGSYVDTRINVHGEKVNISRGLSDAGTNGEITMEDGSTFAKHEIAWGEPYTIKFKPGDGFKLSRFTIRHGYNVDGDSLVNETPQYTDVIIPAYMAKDNVYTIPAKYIDGDVVVTPEFVTATSGGEKGDYALNFDKTLAHSRSDRKLKSVKISTTTHTTLENLYTPNANTVYQDYTAHHIYAKGGDNVNVNIDYAGANNQYMHAYLYVDLDNDGTFSTNLNADGTPAWDGEMLSYNYYNDKNSKGESANCNNASCFAATNSIPQFQIPEGMPAGDYRARLKLDWNDPDPAGRYGKGSNNIDANGGYVVDFTFSVVDEYPTPIKLNVQPTNGHIVGYGNTGLPESIDPLQGYPLLLVGADDTFSAATVNVRRGSNLDGEQEVDGVQQWVEENLVVDDDGVVIIPAADVTGDEIRVTAAFVSPSTDYKLVFDDEFEQEDGTQPSDNVWSRSGWATPAWKRFTAQTEAGQKETGYIEDGKLVLRCLKNTHTDEVNKNTNAQLTMISGAVETSGKYNFTYGKVEARLKTNGHTGNFPAFWMMPQNSTYGGWPYSGEIDIFEQINTEDKSYHTIHSKWANSTSDGSECKGQSGNPTKSGTSATTTGEYHVYGLEWTENLLKWFVDGKQVFSYAKSTTQSDLDNGQWPFDKPFYIILNQSVGNGSWASNPDTSYTYETKFDYVRVYRTDAQITGVSEGLASNDFDYYVSTGNIRLVAPQTTHVAIVDAQGRTVFASNVQGNKDVHLVKGVYLVNGNKVLVP